MTLTTNVPSAATAGCRCQLLLKFFHLNFQTDVTFSKSFKIY